MCDKNYTIYLVRYNQGSSGWYTAKLNDFYYFSGYSMKELLDKAALAVPVGSKVRWQKI